MNQIKKGFECAIKHGLAIKEMELLISFMEGPKSTIQIAKEKDVPLTTIHAVITKLKLKGLILEVKRENNQKIFKINLI